MEYKYTQGLIIDGITYNIPLVSIGSVKNYPYYCSKILLKP